MLVDMVGDEDASVRKAAAQSLAKLGRAGLVAYARFLVDDKNHAHELFGKIGEIFAGMGAAWTRADLAGTMSADQRASFREAGAANLVILTRPYERDTMLDILTAALEDPDEQVRAMTAASLAVLGWSSASKEHPASLADMKKYKEMAVGPEDDEFNWTACAASSVISILVPRGKWPKLTQWWGEDIVEPETDASELDAVRKTLAGLEKASPGGRQWELSRSLLKLRGMGASAEPAAVQLVRLLEKVRPLERIDVARTLLKIAPARSATAALALGRVLDGDDLRARERALLLLAEMGAGAKPAVPALIKVLGWSETQDGSGNDVAGQCAQLGLRFQFARRSKRAAATILGALGRAAAAAKPALEALRSHRDARLRYHIATALRRIG